MDRAARTQWLVALGLSIACGEGTPAAPATDESTGSGETSASGPDTSASSTPATSTTGPTTASNSTEPADSSGVSAGSSSGESGGAFSLDVHTELVDGALALRCNLPRALDACLELEGAPCDDDDGDGLTDAWEDLALDRLRPLRRLDEGESLVDDGSVILGDVGRVFAVGDHIRVFVMLGYSSDYGSCGGFTGHNGDSERVALDLVDWPDGGPGGVVVANAYTAAHEGTANDHSRRFAADELDLLVFDLDPRVGEPRWVVFPSRNKHGSYASVEICESISVIPCVDEDCAPDGVDDLAAFDRLPDAVNAGEPDAPRVTALDELGFVGDDAWAEQDFCGGLGGSSCSAPVRDKLTVDPF